LAQTFLLARSIDALIEEFNLMGKESKDDIPADIEPGALGAKFAPRHQENPFKE
jgi:hypothetical protein